ncbi:MAG: BTAD domain-containing putative transcriptional regulator [Acidimicrobiia bacterium]|nr:BTAD domain-containing putative transcriptional regulator [Acidimicrobiia bacterium]
MRIQLLGRVQAFTDLDEELPIGGPKQRAVLARLAITPGKPVSVDQLIEAVWGQQSPQRAHRSLATYVSNLRKGTGLTITGGAGSYTLETERGSVDLCVFEDEMAQLDGAREAADPDGEAHRRAVGRFVGMPFADVDQHGSFTVEAIRLNELRLTALEQAIDADVRAGRGHATITELETLVAEHPDRERLRGLLMRALYGSGRHTEALQVYDTYRRQLQDLGLDPSPDLRDLELAILRHDDSLVRPTAAPAAELPHRRLPARYSTFIGRREEIDRVRSSMEERRLITIVGPGGIGKSSIALEAVRGAELLAGCEVVQTAFETVDEGAVGSSLAEAIGLQPSGDADPIDVITGYLGDDDYVLILDGCEARPGEIASMVDRILVASPSCRVIATSRVPLALPGERLIRVAGLPIDDAVELFADRADLDSPLADSIAVTVATVCEALDGMALAIELAAARARSIPLDELEQRVERQMPLLRRSSQSDGRHDSMARAIEWSTNLLTEAEARAYRWLAVFSTGFRLRDAVGLLTIDEVDDLVARLVEVSLLQPADENGEYHYLEPIRQHAVHALEEAGDRDAAHEAHARWMVEAAQSAFIDEWSPRRRAMRTWLFRRRSEFLDAVRWASDNGHPDLAIGIFAAIGKIIWSFEDIGHILQPMVAAFDDPDAAQSPDLAIALADAAWAFKAYDRPDDAQAFVERAEAIVEAFDGGSREEMRAEGTVMARRAIFESPEVVRGSDVDLAGQAIGMLERSESPNAGSFEVNRGELLHRLHRHAEATRAHERANAWYLATTGRASPLSLNHLAIVTATQQGQWDNAIAHARESAQIQIDDYDYVGATGSYYVMGFIAMLCGHSVAEPAEQLDHISRITGRELPFILDMWRLSELGDSDGVMRHAKRWFTIRTWHRVDNTEYMSHDMDLTVYGDENTLPRFIAVLLPIARALEAAGKTEDARAIAQEIPTIIDKARVETWGVFDLLEIWRDMRQRLDVGAPTGMTMQEVFDLIRHVVLTYAIDDEGARRDLTEDAELVAPPTFTRIRDV